MEKSLLISSFRATLQPGGTALPLTESDDGVVVTVNDLGMHAMVIFE